MSGSLSQATAYLGLGANWGPPAADLTTLRLAVETLDQQPGVEVDRRRGIASLYRSAPVGGPPGQNHYLNSVLRVFSALPPSELLQTALRVEQRLGRVRAERDGPRVIDIDLLLFDDVLLDQPGLTLPHPRLHERRFVLEPLCELAARVIHPAFELSVRSLLRTHRSSEFVQPVERVAGEHWLNEAVEGDLWEMPEGG